MDCNTDEPLIMLGMMRPNWDKIYQMAVGCYVECRCRMTLTHFGSVREHYDLGHFDKPVTCTKSEMLEKVSEKLAKEMLAAGDLSSKNLPL